MTLDYVNHDVQIYTSSCKTSNVYLYGAHKVFRPREWLDLTLGMDGQVAGNSTPVGIAAGLKLYWQWEEVGLTFPFLLSYYKNTAMTMDFKSLINYKNFLFGFKMLSWFEVGETGVNEIYWTLGYKFNL